MLQTTSCIALMALLATSTALTIAGVFGSTVDLGKTLREFDFSKIDVTNKEKKDYLHVGLAPSFGSLTNESIKKLDDKLKVMITAVTKAIAKIPPDARTWDKVVSALQQNLLIEPSNDGIHRSDKLIKEVNVFKTLIKVLKVVFNSDGSPEDSDILQEVKSWFVTLIGDSDVLRETGIDINVLARIVAQIGAAVESFETLVFERQVHSKTLLDMSVLRYPDIDHPYFKVYRIKLDAWADSTRNLFVESMSGITGEFNVRSYKPRESVLKTLKEDIFQQAANEAEAFLSS